MRLAEIVDSVRNVHPGRVVAILLVYAASILLLGIRWHTLVRMAGGASPWSFVGGGVPDFGHRELRGADRAGGADPGRTDRPRSAAEPRARVARSLAGRPRSMWWR